MEPLTVHDTQELLTAVQDIHNLKSVETFRRDSLAILARLISAESSLSLASRTDFSNMTLQSLDPDFESFVQTLLPALMKYGNQSPLFANVPLILKGAHKNSDFIDRESFHQQEIYIETMRPMGVDDVTMVILVDVDSGRLPSGDELVLQYSFYHPWEKLSERNRLMLSLLQSHLLQSYQTVCKYQQFQQQIEDLHQSLDRAGVIFLDILGRVELMTAQSAMCLQSYFPGYNNFYQLPELLHSWFKHQLTGLKSVDHLPSAQLPLRFQQNNRQLTVRLSVDIPGTRYLLILAEEEVLSVLTALELLGLTQREAEILSGLIRGQSNQEIATELEISLGTVRKHLEHIYEKLGVQRRTEAISIALEKLGCLNISSQGIIH
jgi:DNA-binding CsgD family transcriptional regulator